MKTKLSFELGMPHLGRTNLSESALFKVIGNDRWSQIQTAGAVPTALIRDDAGARLYATFFFFELNLSPERPLSAYGENEVLEFEADLAHFGKIYLDGRHVLCSHNSFLIRSCNVFIYQERGPSKLSISPPANIDFSRIPGLPLQPDSLDLCRQAKLRGSFLDPEPEDSPIFDGSREFIYDIDADRDLNGAGLVYFANFIAFLDLAERRILSALPDPMPMSLLDERSTYRRRIGYYGNAQATDRLHISVKASMRTATYSGNHRVLDMGFDYRVCRSSDGKEIVISSSRKVAPLLERSTEEWVNTWANRRRAEIRSRVP